jgi:hypothetical protein
MHGSEIGGAGSGIDEYGVATLSGLELLDLVGALVVEIAFTVVTCELE